MIRRILALGMLAGLAACSPPPPTAAPTGVDAAGAAANVPLAGGVSRLNIGDIEAHVSLALRIDAESKGPNVLAEEDWSRRQRLALANTTLTAPYPENLWLALEIDSRQAFTSEAVLLTSTIFVEEKPVATFTDILGADAAETTVIHKVDVMKNLDAVRKSFLVRAEAVATLYLDKAREDIDPETAERPAGSTATLPSNTMRITMK